jgi:deazaflavin-dependent oxidoreductase (nitroreductase family)
MNDQVIKEFRANEGKVVEALGGVFRNTELLLLHHIGAKSGAEYVVPLAFMRDGGAYILLAANGGRPHHPGWYYNLLAHPGTRIEVGTQAIKVRARETAGAEREALAARGRTETAPFGRFEQTTARRIPIVVLDPVSGD